MITVTDARTDARLYRWLEWAIMRQKPITITYLKQSKDAEGHPLWELQEGVRVPVLEPTIRTVEPWAFEKPGTDDAYVRGMDRDSNEPRSWRLDRITKITYHRRGKQIIPAYVGMSNNKRA